MPSCHGNTFLFVSLLVCLRVTNAWAGEAARTFEAGISWARSFGDTRYELNALAPDPRDQDLLVEIRSELEFPLETDLLGAELRWALGGQPSPAWHFSLAAHLDVGGSRGNMTDGDWIAGRQISYTESPSDLDLFMIETGARRRVFESGDTRVDAGLDLYWHQAEYEIVGYEGWRGSLFSDQRFPVSGMAPILDYRVRTAQALAAFDLRQGLGSWACLEILGGGGLAYAWDRDDHLLRGRISEGHGWGYALDGRTELQLLPELLPGPLTLTLFGDVRYTSTEGDVDQRWYRDEDLPAGTEINDIPYEIRTTHWMMGVRLGAAF